MSQYKKIAIIGGDLRQIKMAEYLINSDYNVNIFGFNQEQFSLNPALTLCNSLDQTLKDSDVVILGLPCSLDDETINTPLYNQPIYLKDFLRLLNKNSLLVGGLISNKVHNMIKLHGIFAVDYFEREELQVQNAVPSAEGAIQIAMEETPITINGSHCLVLGFGRIGKVLCKMLNGIGAKVSCTARRHDDIAWIKSYGYNALYTSEIDKDISRFDIVFNTIPCKIIGRTELSLLKGDCLIIDLASKPGGVDMNAAKELGKKVIWALSLPGKVAPSTAGKIIKDTVINIMNELGV